MSTVSLDLGLTLLRNGGHYSDDPLPDSIWIYTNQWNNKAIKILYYGKDLIDFLDSPYVHEPICLWDAKDGLTKEGECLLKSN